MSWNYRVVRRVLEHGEIQFGIHEAFYNKGETVPHSITVDPVRVVADSEEGIGDVISMMRHGKTRPILNWEDFCNEPKDQ